METADVMKIFIASILLSVCGLTLQAQNFINNVNNSNIDVNNYQSQINYNPQSIQFNNGNEVAMNINDNVNFNSNKLQVNDVNIVQRGGGNISNQKNAVSSPNVTNQSNVITSNNSTKRSYNGSKRKNKSKFEIWVYNMKKSSRKSKVHKPRKKHHTSKCAKWH